TEKMSRSAYGAPSVVTARVPGGARVSNNGQPHTPVIDLLDTDEARGLLETGRENGSLSTEEITLALDELDVDAAQLDDFYHALDELQIEVVDGRAQAAVGEELDLDADSREFSTDALQLFLKDIGKVDLLTAAQEVELAKR